MRKALLLLIVIHLRPASDYYDLRCLVIVFRSYFGPLFDSKHRWRFRTSSYWYKLSTFPSIYSDAHHQLRRAADVKNEGKRDVGETLWRRTYISSRIYITKPAQFKASAQLAYCHASHIYLFESGMVWCAAMQKLGGKQIKPLVDSKHYEDDDFCCSRGKRDFAYRVCKWVIGMSLLYRVEMG